MTTPCHLFETGPGTGPFNMETDERLLGWVESNPDSCTLRFFSWSEPTLTIGRTQFSLLQRPSPDPLSPSLCRATDIPSSTGFAGTRLGHPAIGEREIVRRPTGGGLVLHQPGEMSFSFCWGAESNRPHPLSNAGGTRGIYKSLHQIFKEALEKLGYKCELATADSSLRPKPSLRAEGEAISTLMERSPRPFGPRDDGPTECFRDYVESDILWSGKKILGGALWRTKKAFLYEGTLKISEIQPTIAWNQTKEMIASKLEVRLGLKILDANSFMSASSRAFQPL
jgi:lipoate-protein ligase A